MRFRLRWQPSIAVLALGLTAAGLAGCRSSPNVAAYVGDDTISVAALDRAVDARLADDAIAHAIGDDEATYTQTVLTELIRTRVYDAAARHYGVAAPDGQVRDLLAALIGSNDPDDVYDQAAAQGLSRADVFEVVREQLLRQRIAEAEGLADEVDDAALRQRYEQARSQYTTPSYGLVNVPDQPTADALLADLTADPASYPVRAAEFPGDVTTPAVGPVQDVPQLIASQVAAAAPDTGFTVTASDVVGVVVVFVGQPEVVGFDEVRDSLAAQASSEAAEAAESEIADFTDDLGVTLNPRYGSFDDGTVGPLDGSSVRFLDRDDTAGSDAASSSGS